MQGYQQRMLAYGESHQHDTQDWTFAQIKRPKLLTPHQLPQFPLPLLRIIHIPKIRSLQLEQAWWVDYLMRQPILYCEACT
jgi:hypothetical protein